MSKKNGTPKAAPSKTIRQWAEHVAGALVHLDGVTLTERERDATATVHNIAVTLNLYLGGEASEIDLAAVERACRAPRAPRRAPPGRSTRFYRRRRRVDFPERGARC